MATMISNRRSTFGISCVRCGEELLAPDKSEYRAGTHIRHLWHCPNCSTRFEFDRADSRRDDDDGRYLSSTTRRVVKCGRVREGADRLQLRTGPLPFLKLL